MIKIHERDLRGKSKGGWLDSAHTYSFGGFHDPNRMGFKSLRVFNDDRVIGGAGFPPHHHDNMEIISYVIQGALEHKDSTGTGAVIRPGDIQRMSAGKGIEHSEFNHSKDKNVHFLQIWILPDTQNIHPSYEQKSFAEAEYKDGFKLVGDSKGTNGGITIHQDIKMFVAKSDDGDIITYQIDKGRGAFLHVVRGLITINNQELREGDAIEITEISTIEILAKAQSELILLDME